MTTSRTQILAMIASAMNQNEDGMAYADTLSSMDTTPSRDGIIMTMTDGSRFRIVPEAI